VLVCSISISDSSVNSLSPSSLPPFLAQPPLLRCSAQGNIYTLPNAPSASYLPSIMPAIDSDSRASSFRIPTTRWRARAPETRRPELVQHVRVRVQRRVLPPSHAVYMNVRSQTQSIMLCC